MILAILQARVSSTRLFAKVLLPILENPMLLRQIERLQQLKNIDHLIVATSHHNSDDAIEKICSANNIICYRGSLDDVLDRYYYAAQLFNCNHIVRLTGDCPLTDPKLIDEMIEYHLSHEYDYTSNTIEPTYPDGLDVEIFRFSCLKEAWENATLPSQREHVTPYIYQQNNKYKIGSYKNTSDLSFLRWTVDEKEDFDLISKIYQSLYPKNPLFTTEDVLSLLEKTPTLQILNTHHKRNDGMKKSLQQDIKLLQRETAHE